MAYTSEMAGRYQWRWSASALAVSYSLDSGSRDVETPSAELSPGSEEQGFIYTPLGGYTPPL